MARPDPNVNAPAVKKKIRQGKIAALWCGREIREAERKQCRCARHALQPAPWRVEHHPDEPRQDEEDSDLASHHEGDERDGGEDGPESAIVLHGHSEELPGPTKDQRDDGRADAVEECLDQGRPPERDVQRGDDAHDDERRQDEWDRRGDCAPEAAAYVAEPHRELRGERARQGLRDGETLEVFLLREPPAALDEVTLHVGGESDRPAEAERPQSQKVPRKIAQPELALAGHVSLNTSAPPRLGAKA